LKIGPPVPPVSPEGLKGRTKRFALGVLRLADSLPHTAAGQTVGRELLRAGTSVAANYRAVCRARSRAEFVAKLRTVVEEADESVFWLELIIEGGLLNETPVRALLPEANEILSIMIASRKTAGRNG
jgi:four helix bundle protein